MRKLNVNLLFLITKISNTMRIFIAVSIMACYGLFLYEILPEYLFSFPFSLYYFILPLVAISGVLIVAPRILAKGAPNQSQDSGQAGVLHTQSDDIITPDSAQTNGIIQSNSGSGAILSDAVLPSPSQASGITGSSTMQQPVVDESLFNDMIARAMEPIQRETKKMQENMLELKNQVGSLRSEIQSVTETFEASLTDLKAFQTEVANPLNFMHKILDSIDIKSFLEPTLPAHIGQSQYQDRSNPELSHAKKDTDVQEHARSHLQGDRSADTAGDTAEIPKQMFSESLPFKQMFNGSFTLGKLMTTITILEEILQVLDKDSIDILVEQCKSMGLRQEDEHVIYNIINMMEQSGSSVREILIMIYKLGKVMGISDSEADLVYAKLMMNSGKSSGPLMTVESKGS